MLVKRPHQQQKAGRDFMVKELQFNQNQTERFRFLSHQHRETMKEFDDEIKQFKDILFNSLSKVHFSSDSISNKIGALEAEKEKELFAFFRELRKICSAEQVSIFDSLIKKALLKKGRKPPRERRRHPPI